MHETACTAFRLLPQWRARWSTNALFGNRRRKTEVNRWKTSEGVLKSQEWLWCPPAHCSPVNLQSFEGGNWPFEKKIGSAQKNGKRRGPHLERKRPKNLHSWRVRVVFLNSINNFLMDIPVRFVLVLFLVEGAFSSTNASITVSCKWKLPNWGAFFKASNQNLPGIT